MLIRPTGRELIGALDMGGSSTQMIFYTKNATEDDLITHDDFWSHSWLNYGVQKMRERTWDYVLSTEEESETERLTILNPCSFKGHLTLPTDDGYILRGTGDSDRCMEIIRNVVWPVACKREAEGVSAACAIDGIKHPPLKGQFYGMSVYFYAIDCINELGGSPLLSW